MINYADSLLKPKKVGISGIDLQLRIEQFLADNFIFRKLEIDSWTGGGIRYIERELYLENEFSDHRKAEYLLEAGIFRNWRNFSLQSINGICEEFLWRNLSRNNIGSKKRIKKIILDFVNETAITKIIRSDPSIKLLIENGRQKTKRITPLPYSSQNRKNIELEIGDTCYICRDMSGPYIASPAYVLKKLENAYRIMFFTNVREYSETKELSVNQLSFLSVQCNELGKTPEEAVRQKY